jgi:hypothetical protein
MTTPPRDSSWDSLDSSTLALEVVAPVFLFTLVVVTVVVVVLVVFFPFRAFASVASFQGLLDSARHVMKRIETSFLESDGILRRGDHYPSVPE